MPVFEYSALNQKGKKVGGLITAEGPSAARLKLSRDSIFPTKIREVADTERKSATEALLARFGRFRKINPVEITTALRQLATLVSSGLPLLECLNGVIEQTEQSRLKKIFTQVREKVVEGASLSRAMAEHPSVFDSIFVNLVMAGETGGALSVILKRLADFSESKIKLRRKVESAMAYPVLLLMITSIILIFLMTFVMPKVIGVFKGMDLSLPWSTRALIWLTNGMSQYWWLLISGFFVLFLALNVWTKTESGARIWDHIRLHIPLIGNLHHKTVIIRFTRTLSTLLQGGIPLVEALEIARPVGNLIIDDAIGNAAKLVGEGSDLATPLRNTGRFPPLVVQLIKAGEQSGDLEGMLAKAAESYEDDVEAAITSLTSVMEVFVILAMGMAVLFIVMAILLPIFDMTRSIRR